MTPLVFVVAVLACYRATLLITADKLTEPVREAILEALDAYDEDGVPLEEWAQPHPKLVYLVTCEWCASTWLAPVFVGSGFWWASGWAWWLICGSLAASGVTGFLAEYARPDS